MMRKAQNAILAWELFLVSINFFFVYFFLREFHPIYHFDLVTSTEVIRGPLPLDLYMNAFWAGVFLWACILWLRGGYRNLQVQTYPMAIRYSVVTGLIFF